MRRVLISTLGLGIAAAVAVAAVAPVAQAKRNKKNQPPPELTALVDRVTTGRSNFFVRNAFDTDPSPYFGRFVPDGTTAAAIDDAAAMQTVCSEHLSYTYVGGGGVSYDDYFNASTSVSVGLGVPLMSQVVDAEASVGYEGGAVVRVRYELMGKMVATIDDPEAFAACCEDGPGRCTGLFLGEFLEGTGEMYSVTGHSTGVNVGVGAKGVEASVDVKDGVAWEKSITFPNPVYFAFKTTTVPPDVVQTFGECGDWMTVIPRSNRGMYFVGLSDVNDTERAARDQARRDARVQVVQYLGEAIEAGSIELRATSGAAGDLSTQLQSDAFVTAAAQGVAELVKDRAWCIEQVETPGGLRYSAHALTFLPQASEEEAAGRLGAPGRPADDGAPEAPTDGTQPPVGGGR